ncbi:hypothetical protein L6164_012614 [Bauhinia variegata]|uniref:Uncharacterized protein n=1 Tax=Bauhinia variegata TaxID=167791 RepID=A0ACB9PDF9_BAUVA|nr:hypothetical protein L6164_012614 [Bauhinia variegata]
MEHHLIDFCTVIVGCRITIPEAGEPFIFANKKFTWRFTNQLEMVWVGLNQIPSSWVFPLLALKSEDSELTSSSGSIQM